MNPMERCDYRCQKYAMAEVPVQQWGELYDWDSALYHGTIFQDLNLPFFAAPIMSGSSKPCGCKEDMMKWEIYCISFAINDLTLYLDTHPSCDKGMVLFAKLVERRKELLDEFTHQFYPLTTDCMSHYVTDSHGLFSWGDCPAPWEGGMC